MPEPEFSHTGMYSGTSVQTLLRKRARTTGTQAERVLTDHLPCPQLMGKWGAAWDERLHSLCLQLKQLHQLRLSSCLGSCRGGSTQPSGVWKNRRDQAPALPLKGHCTVNPGLHVTTPWSPPLVSSRTKDNKGRYWAEQWRHCIAQRAERGDFFFFF